MKRSVKAILLLAVLAVLLGGYKLILSMSEKAQVSEESGAFALTDKKVEDLIGLSWTNGDVYYHFAKSDSAWTNVDDAGFPVNQDAVQSLADSLTSLTADRKLENVENTADYGINESAFTVTGEWADGTQTQYQMGDETPFADGYYVTLSGDTSVYTVSSALNTMFSDTLTDLAQLEEMPVVENASRLVIGAAVDATYKETSSTLKADQHWYGTLDGAALMDESVGALIEAMRGLAWSKLVSVSASDDEMIEWQLKGDIATALELYGDGDNALKLLIGTTDENGDYYARLFGSNMVYTVAADSLSDLMSATTSQLLNTQLIALAFEDLRKVEFTSNAQSWSIERAESVSDIGDEETAVSGEATGSEQTETAITVNGNAVGTSELESLWALIEGMTMAEPEPSDVKEGDLLLSVSVSNEAGIGATFEFYAYDAQSYIVKASDGTKALVSADTIDKIIRTLKQL